MGQSGQEDKKKIKTESGRFISSSYKRDLYQKWKQKQKIDDRDSEEEGPSNQRGPGPRRGGKRGRSQGGQGRWYGVNREKARRCEVPGWT